MKKGKGPTAESENAYWGMLKNKFGELFKLGYELIITKCKHVPRPMVGPDL
jgi:hypothetical protein